MKLTNYIQKAINLASTLHLGQLRKGDNNLPYISHPFSVAWILADYVKDEDIIIAGLLHDVLEDVKEYNFEDLKGDFGERVATIVKDVSEDKDPNVETDEKATWQDRKQKYLDHLTSSSEEAMFVCVADKIHNLRSMTTAYREQGDALWEKFNSPQDKKIWFYEEVYNITKDKLDSEIILELEKEINQLRKLLRMSHESTLIGFTMDKETQNFDVNLINNSSVKIYTGAYVSIDEDLLETSKVVKDKGKLPANSVITIDTSDWDELDYVIWYHVDLIKENGEIEKFWFQLPKYGWAYDSNLSVLPVMNKQGMVIELIERGGESIEVETKNADMNYKYHKHEIDLE